jgi:hypothetical protein
MTKISALSDIGTSVASNDTFVLVDVSDPTTPNKKIQQQNLFLIPDGSAGTPGLRFLSDTNVGLFRPTTDTLAIATGGSERLRIDSSGRLGLGTSSPGALFHIEAAGNTVNQRIFTSDNVLNATASLTFGTTPGTRSKAAVQMVNTNTGNAAGALALQTNDGSGLTTRLYINDAGSVGIGTATPGATLDICPVSDRGVRFSGTLASHSQIVGTQGTTSGNLRPLIIAGSELSFATGSNVGTSFTEYLKIDGTGRVGIGTTSPSELLHVAGGNARIGNSSGGSQAVIYNGANAELLLWEGNGVSGNADTTRLGVGRNNTSLICPNNSGTPRTAFAVGTAAAEPLVFSTNNTERARIDSSGRLLVGTSSALGSERLNVDGRYIVQTATKLLGANGTGNNTLALSLPSVKYIAGHLYVSSSPEAANKGTVSIYKVFIQTISGQTGISTLTLEQTVDSSFSAGITVSLSNRVITVTNTELGYNNQCRMVFHGMATN